MVLAKLGIEGEGELVETDIVVARKSFDARTKRVKNVIKEKYEFFFMCKCFGCCLIAEELGAAGDYSEWRGGVCNRSLPLVAVHRVVWLDISSTRCVVVVAEDILAHWPYRAKMHRT